MKYISYDQAEKLVKNNKDKILIFVLGKKDCVACSTFSNSFYPNLKQEDNLEIYGLNLDKDYKTIFPPLKSPMFYFYTAGSEVYPMIRENLPPENIFIGEIEQQKKILNGESFYEVYKKVA